MRGATPHRIIDLVRVPGKIVDFAVAPLTLKVFTN
jgi:hypothetical protein